MYEMVPERLRDLARKEATYDASINIASTVVRPNRTVDKVGVQIFHGHQKT
jgi:hypothetical protein